MRNNCNPCKPEYRPGDECSIYSSQIIYDGQSFPEADIRNGDSMNSVIESLVRKLVAVSAPRRPSSVTRSRAFKLSD